MSSSSYDDKNDSQLWVEIVKLAKEKPEPKGAIRHIQSILEARHRQELASAAPDWRRIKDLELTINGIDMSYLQDPSKYGTFDWRAEHPWEPSAVNESDGRNASDA